MRQDPREAQQIRCLRCQRGKYPQSRGPRRLGDGNPLNGPPGNEGPVADTIRTGTFLRPAVARNFRRCRSGFRPASTALQRMAFCSGLNPRFSTATKDETTDGAENHEGRQKGRDESLWSHRRNPAWLSGKSFKDRPPESAGQVDLESLSFRSAGAENGLGTKRLCRRKFRRRTVPANAVPRQTIGRSGRSGSCAGTGSRW